MEEHNFIREIHKTLKKQVLNEFVDRNLIKNAIEKKRVIQIFYKGDETEKAGYRTIEPYLLGVTSGTTGGGNVAVRAWQQAGDSDSASGIISNRYRARATRHDRDNMPGWRLFRLDGIKEAIPLNARFAKNDVFRPKYNPNDKRMTQIFYRVTKGDDASFDQFGRDSVDDPNVTITQGDRLSNVDMTNQNTAWNRFYQEPEEAEKIRKRIGQFGKVVKKKRKEKLSDYYLMVDKDMGDYKLVSKSAVENNYRGKYPPEEVIGNMDDLVGDYIINNQNVDTTLFTQGQRDVKQANDKKKKELE